MRNYLPTPIKEYAGYGFLGGRIGSSAIRALGLQKIDSAINYVVEQTMSKATAHVKNHYGKSFKFKRPDSIAVLSWLQAHDKNFKNHIDNPQVLGDPSGHGIEMVRMENDQMFMVTLDDGTFAYVHVYNEYSKYSNFIYTNNNDDRSASAGFYEMSIYIFGKYMKRYADELTKMTASSLTGKLCQYIVMGGTERSDFTITAKEVNTRPIDSLFFSDNTIQNIINHIDNWLKNEPIYKERSLPFKTGIMLQGEPGTGKSSLVVALATYFNMEIININMPTFRTIDIDKVIDSINADDNKYIILMEEIDCVFGKADRQEGADKEDKKYISDLLQFIDSPKSPTNVIFIATTNYPDRLDKALVRKGRFDLIANVGPLTNMDAVRDMCKSFRLSSEHIDRICNGVTLPCHQSDLQCMIMEEINRQLKSTEDTSEEDEEHVKELLEESEPCAETYNLTTKMLIDIVYDLGSKLSLIDKIIITTDENLDLVKHCGDDQVCIIKELNDAKAVICDHTMTIYTNVYINIDDSLIKSLKQDEIEMTHIWKGAVSKIC